MFTSDCSQQKDEKQTLELTSRPPAVYPSVLLPPQNFLPPSSHHPSPPLSYNPPPLLRLNPVIFVENYTITKFLSLPWDNILVIAAAQELGQNQETSSAPVHHWSHFDMQIKQMQAFRPSL